MLFALGIDNPADVLAIRQQAVQALKDGAKVVAWNTENTSVTKVLSFPPDKIILEANEFLRAALPDVYGRRVKRTVPYFIN